MRVFPILQLYGVLVFLVALEIDVFSHAFAVIRQTGTRTSRILPNNHRQNFASNPRKEHPSRRRRFLNHHLIRLDAAVNDDDDLSRGDARGAAMMLEDVSVSRGSAQILSNIDWRIEPNSKWALVGTNGCGKSK